MNRLFTQYADLQQRIKDQTAERINLSRAIKLSQWRERFVRNPAATTAEDNVEIWARCHGIWLEKYSYNTNTMGGYLHPETANQQKLELINQMYVILFYIDDTYANELIKSLEPARREEGKEIIASLLNLLRNAYQLHAIPTSRFGVINAACDFLQALKKDTESSPLGDRWFRNFIASLKDHLTHAAVDQNDFVASLEGENPQRFIQLRNDISGMFVATAFMEFATGKYMDWQHLPDGVPMLCQRLDYLAAVIGVLTNEIFSFEKEVIINRDAFNMIVVLMLQNPPWDLYKAIFKCVELLNEASDEFEDVSKKLYDLASTLPQGQSDVLKSYVRQAQSVAIASLTWEVDTDRYEIVDAIFDETDYAWRRHMKLTNLLKSGKPLPSDYFNRLWDIYNSPL